MSDEVKALRDALRMCLEFISTEQGWESFRADYLYADHDPKRTASEENARVLANFLAKPEIKGWIKDLLP